MDIEAKNLKKKFDKDIFNDINFKIKSGEFVGIVGRNGSGKTTLVKHLNGLLKADEGIIYIGKNEVNNENIEEIRKNISFVFQNPDDQIIGTTVEEDVAFGPENLDFSTEMIREKVNYSLEKVGMFDKKNSLLENLSGGEKQRVAISSAIAMTPKICIFDEVMSMLDFKNKKKIMDIIMDLNKNLSVTIICITHKLEELINADKILLLEYGIIKEFNDIDDFFKNEELLKRNGLEKPFLFDDINDIETRHEEVFCDNVVSDEIVNDGLPGINVECDKANNNDKKDSCLISLENVYFKYDKEDILKDISLDIYENEIIGIMGMSGCGKSTLSMVMSGLYKNTKGKIVYGDELIEDIKVFKDNRRKNKKENKKKNKGFKNISLVFQNPENAFFEETVYDEVAFGAKNLHLDNIDKRVLNALKLMGFNEDIFDKSPYKLSGGEKRRVAIASILSMDTKIIIFDEPFAMLDAFGKKYLLDCMNMLKKKGKTIIIISHDLKEVLMNCTRFLYIENGCIIKDTLEKQNFLDFMKEKYE